MEEGDDKAWAVSEYVPIDNDVGGCELALTPLSRWGARQCLHTSKRAVAPGYGSAEPY